MLGTEDGGTVTCQDCTMDSRVGGDRAGPGGTGRQEEQHVARRRDGWHALHGRHQQRNSLTAARLRDNCTILNVGMTSKRRTCWRHHRQTSYGRRRDKVCERTRAVHCCFRS